MGATEYCKVHGFPTQQCRCMNTHPISWGEHNGYCESMQKHTQTNVVLRPDFNPASMPDTLEIPEVVAGAGLKISPQAAALSKELVRFIYKLEHHFHTGMEMRISFNDPANPEWYASVGIELGGDGILSSVTGRGDSPWACLEDLRRKIVDAPEDKWFQRSSARDGNYFRARWDAYAEGFVSVSVNA